jgi:hypothetical protein
MLSSAKASCRRRETLVSFGGADASQASLHTWGVVESFKRSRLASTADSAEALFT